MTTLSTAASTAHGVGLATAIGGTLYGRVALQPALRDIPDPEERDRITSEAAERFSWLNLAAHGLIAASWFAGRSTLSGRRSAHSLTRVKDGLVITSLVTGIGGVVLDRVLRNRARREAPYPARDSSDGDAGTGPFGGGNSIGNARASRGRGDPPGTRRDTAATHRVMRGLGIVNLLANIAIAGITVLAAER